MKDFAVCFNNKIKESVQVKDELVSLLKQRNLKVKAIDICNLKSGADFVFVTGGDGTILKTARFYAKYKTPVFGVNLGRLGFLSQSSKEDIQKSLDKILNGEFVVENRIMLKCGENNALNDFVIKGSDKGRTAKFSLKINDKFVCDYLADGIIVSTPTGSTAYGLSAGGPVLTPALNAFIIVPICPHTLNARPIVVPDSEKISIHTDKRKYSIALDGQEFFEVDNKDEKEIIIEKSDYEAKLALLSSDEFYSVLRSKLHWATHPQWQK